MPHAMRARFGLSLSTRAVLFDWGTLDDLINAAQMAEASGYFDSVWVGDNLLSKPRVEAIVTLSALGARTEHVRLGTICLASFPLRDPILLALQWASLDVLSKGRTVNINEDRQQAFDEATTFLSAYYGAGAVSQEQAEVWLAYGSPQAVIDKIAVYIDAGCTTPVLRFVSPHPTEQLQRCIDEVLPALQST